MGKREYWHQIENHYLERERVGLIRSYLSTHIFFQTAKPLVAKKTSGLVWTDGKNISEQNMDFHTVLKQKDST